MKKNEIVSGRVIRTDFPDKGYVLITDEDGEHVMTVKGVLPGQEILAKVTRIRSAQSDHKERLVGRLERIVKQAPDSVLSSCPHFSECGGCAYLTMPYSASVKLKEEQVKRLLAPVLRNQGSEPEWENMQVSPERFGYRNKMEFTFGDAYKGGELSLGMHKSGHFHDIVSVPDCRIVDEDYRLILQTTLSFFSPLYENGSISFYNRMQKTGYLRHLLVRKGLHAGQILIDLITTSQPNASFLEPTKRTASQADFYTAPLKNIDDTKKISSSSVLSAYTNALLKIENKLSAKIAGILHTTNDAEADAVIDQGTEILYGRDSFEERLLGITFTVTPFSFFQTNSGGAEVLYKKVREYCEETLQYQNVLQDKNNLPRDTEVNEKKEALRKENITVYQDKKVGTIYDLYCGTGTITQLMSPFAEKVIGVELVPEAVEAARMNAEKNSITNVSFICGDVLKEIENLTETPDLMILDPPRDGIHPKALPKLLLAGAKNIIYVSCKPTGLARDLPYILAHGYTCTHICCVDQFPWTRHIETIVLLKRLLTTV